MSNKESYNWEISWSTDETTIEEGDVPSGLVTGQFAHLGGYRAVARVFRHAPGGAKLGSAYSELQSSSSRHLGSGAGWAEQPNGRKRGCKQNLNAISWRIGIK